MHSSTGESEQPEISIIMPCYNEEQVIAYTTPKLVAAFRDSGHRLELIAVDNGSSDRTGEIIARLAAQDPWIVPHRVEVNEGYGNGILKTIAKCTAPWIGIIPADGPVDPQDVVLLYEAAAATDGAVLAKVRRRFRTDGLLRQVVSLSYNLIIRLLWPTLASLDINASPKLLRREYLMAMNLESKGWSLDPEMMVKAHYMGLRILELNAFARMRSSGLSHVRPATCWELFRSLLTLRFSKRLRGFRQKVRAGDERKPGAMHSAIND